MYTDFPGMDSCIKYIKRCFDSKYFYCFIRKQVCAECGEISHRVKTGNRRRKKAMERGNKQHNKSGFQLWAIFGLTTAGRICSFPFNSIVFLPATAEALSL